MSVVLVVEDEPAIAELIALSLRHAGYEVRQAADAVQAQAQIGGALPDLVLLDWMLPGRAACSSRGAGARTHARVRCPSSC